MIAKFLVIIYGLSRIYVSLFVLYSFDFHITLHTNAVCFVVLAVLPDLHTSQKSYNKLQQMEFPVPLARIFIVQQTTKT